MKRQGLLLSIVPSVIVLFGVSASPVQAQSGCVLNNPVQSLFVTPEVPTRLYLFIHNMLYESIDAGESWTNINMTGLGARGQPAPIELLAIDYRRPTTLYLLAYLTSGDGYFLYRSLDGGHTFYARGQTMPSYRRLATLAVDFRNSDVLYGGLYRAECGGPCGEFVRSTDGGLSWSRFDNAAGSDAFRQPVRNLIADPVHPETLFAETLNTYRFLGGRLYRGDANGNWSLMALPARATPYGFVPSGLTFNPLMQVLWTGTYRAGGLNPPQEDQRLFRSTNVAEPDPSWVQWSPVYDWNMGPTPPCWSTARDSVSPLAVDARNNQLYVRTTTADSALWKSADDGASWRYVVVPPQPGMPLTSETFKWVSPLSKHTVSGSWLTFLQTHGDVDNLGYARSEVIADPMNFGETVQYFQRLIIEYHPENPPAFRLQRRLLGDILYPGADPPHLLSNPPPGPWRYFPFSPDRPTGLGHFVANLTRTGQRIYFKDYFDSHGGVDSFGFPKEEPKVRNGMWTQRFQAAVFEYHPEFDRDGFVPGTTIPYRHYRVLLELLGDEYIRQNNLPYQ